MDPVGSLETTFMCFWYHLVSWSWINGFNGILKSFRRIIIVITCLSSNTTVYASSTILLILTLFGLSHLSKTLSRHGPDFIPPSLGSSLLVSDKEVLTTSTDVIESNC